MLDHAPDPFTALVEASKEREETYFGPSFDFERPIDDQDTYVLNIKRCLFHETLVAADHLHHQPVLEHERKQRGPPPTDRHGTPLRTFSTQTRAQQTDVSGLPAP
jgi:hypothetical protein